MRGGRGGGVGGTADALGDPDDVTIVEYAKARHTPAVTCLWWRDCNGVDRVIYASQLGRVVFINLRKRCVEAVLPLQIPSGEGGARPPQRQHSFANMLSRQAPAPAIKFATITGIFVSFLPRISFKFSRYVYPLHFLIILIAYLITSRPGAALRAPAESREAPSDSRRRREHLDGPPRTAAAQCAVPSRGPEPEAARRGSSQVRDILHLLAGTTRVCAGAAEGFPCG